MIDIASFRDPFIVLLLLTFGVLMAVLGAFLLLWSRGKPRVYGAGFLAIGIVVLVTAIFAVWTGLVMNGLMSIIDTILPGLIYLIAIAIGAVLAVLPFLVVAIRT